MIWICILEVSSHITFLSVAKEIYSPPSCPFPTHAQTTDSLCCIGSSMDWSTYIQTATYNRVTEEQEGNIVSTKKELGVRPTAIPSSQEQSGTGTCYHLGQHQRRHWRDSGQTLLFATQCPATRLPVVDVHSFNRF